MKYVFNNGKKEGGNPTMEPLVPNQTPIVGVPGIPVNTNVTLEDKNRNQEINNPDFKNLQVNMTIPQSPPVNPVSAADHPITLEDLAKGENPVVTPQDIANGAIVVDGSGSTTKTETNNNSVNVNGGNNIMNNNMNQQMNQQQAAQAQQYYQQGIPQQMPMPPQQQMPMPPQQNGEGGFFSSPTVKMVGVGVACAAAGYLGHKYMSASDSAEVAAALGELL